MIMMKFGAWTMSYLRTLTGVSGARVDIRRLRLAFCAICLWLSVAGSAAQETGMRFDPISLADEDWRFRPGDDPEWAAADYDHESWPAIEVTTPWGRQGLEGVEVGWYRVVVEPIPDEMAGPDGNLGLWVGSVASSYRVYAGGRELGGNGALEPQPTIEHDRHRLFSVPPGAARDGRLVLAFRVARHPALGTGHGGIFGRAPELGRLDDLARRSVQRSIPTLFGGFVCALLGMYALAAGWWRRRRGAGVWLAALLLAVAGLGFLGSQSRFWLTDDFQWLKKLEMSLWAVLPVLWARWAQVAARLAPELRSRATRFTLPAYAGFVLVWTTVLWLSPGLGTALSYGWLVQLAGLVVVALGLAWALKPGSPSAGWPVLRVGIWVAAGLTILELLLGSAGIRPVSVLLIGFPILGLTWIYEREIEAHRRREDLQQAQTSFHEQLESRTLEIGRALREAESKSRSRIEFLAGVSHEIRTPMMGILGIGDLLLKCDLGFEERRYAETIRSSAVALLGVLDDILDFSKIEAGYLTLKPEAFELREAVRGIVELLAPKATEKGVELRSEVWDEAPRWVWGDPWRLRQVLINLVGNAIKFTHEGAVILEVLPARQASGSDDLVLRFAVRDTGVGVAPQEIPSLFDPFTQTGSRAQQSAGTGLGLAISRRIVDAMKGRMGADSQIGLGSNFWFEVPLRRAEEPSQASVLAGPSRSFKHGRVLLVDDNEVNRIVILGQLKSLGAQAEAVHNGEEAVDAVSHGHYDVVLMDCRMPRMDGYEATRRIRAMGRESLPVVAVTAQAFEGERERCLEAGMDDYLVKPFEEDQLAAVLDRWMAPAGLPPSRSSQAP